MPIQADAPSYFDEPLVFPETAIDFWRTLFLGGTVLREEATLVVAVAALPEDHRVMTLEMSGGRTWIVLAPALADPSTLDRLAEPDGGDLKERLRAAGIEMHGADHVFHFPASERSALVDEPAESGTRRLDQRDEALFSEFLSRADERDLDDACVALDHWVVFGRFHAGRLVSVASMYPWMDSKIADTGVVTLPAFKRKGHARAVVRAISRHAVSLGYEPQYRCQPDNHASMALARAAGLALFGKWDSVAAHADA